MLDEARGMFGKGLKVTILHIQKQRAAGWYPIYDFLVVLFWDYVGFGIRLQPVFFVLKKNLINLFSLRQNRIGKGKGPENAIREYHLVSPSLCTTGKNSSLHADTTHE